MPAPALSPLPNDGAAVAYDPDGHQVANRVPIAQASAGGTLVAAGAADTALTAAAGANQRHYMQRLFMQCTVAPTADGLISIKDAAAGTIIFQVQAETAMAQGTQLNFPFDTPLPSATAGALVVDSAANTGTWRYFVVGYDMSTLVLV